MNFLAHAYLSFGYSELLVGNLISDFVKGKKQYAFPSAVQEGILLHRAIDNFTDTHPATKSAKERFRPSYRLYAAAFVDVVYDHFLAADPEHFSPDTLFDFSQHTYQKLERYTGIFPAGFATLFPYMQQQNWLYHYHSKQGAIQSFGGIIRRAAYLTDASPAKEIFLNDYDELKACYQSFFPDLYAFVKNRVNNLTQ